MRVLTFIAATAIALGAPVAQAKTLFQPPHACETFLTVQSRGCRVSHYYRCEADAPGDQWRADFDQDGMYFVSRIDTEAQWVESFEMFPATRQALDASPVDPASFSALLAGRDDFDFRLTKDDGSQSHVTGHDALTGKSFTIDGITLQQTEFDFTEVDASGTQLRRSRGNEFIHPEWRLFFSGPSEWESEGAWVPVDGSPVQFTFPGEPGFAATEPLFDCDAILSSVPKMSVPNTSKATEAQSHDDL